MTQRESPDSTHDAEIERQLKRTLHGSHPDLDVDRFLGEVRTGARRRSRRRAVAGAVATVAVIAVGVAVAAPGLFGNGATPAADGGTKSLASGPDSPTPTGSHLRSGVASRVLSLSATGTEHQYVLLAGNEPCHRACTEVDITTDAGRTWHHAAALDVPAGHNRVEQTVSQVRFAGNGSDGWAFGGALRSTHDGGATWTSPLLPVRGAVTLLEAWGASVYASVYDRVSGTTTVVRSPSDRDMWKQVLLGTPLSGVTTIAVSQDLVAVLGSPTQLSVDNQILASTDGRRWTDVSPCRGRHWPSDVSTGGGALWTICSGQGGSAPQVSTDQGATWTVAPGHFSSGSLVQARTARSAAVVDPSADGISLISLHHAPRPILAEQGTMLPIGFTNPSTGYLRTSGGGVLRTTDGGFTWQPYPLP